MEFKFDANQGFQLEAIQAVIDLPIGQPRTEAKLRQDQARHGNAPDGDLLCIKERIEMVEGTRTTRFYNSSVEMEMGTGRSSAGRGISARRWGWTVGW
jgi:hypothetical protein